MRTTFQQAVAGATALAIAVTLLLAQQRPFERFLTAAGVAFLSAGVYALGPVLWPAAQRRKRTTILLLTAVLIALRLLIPVQLAPRLTSNQGWVLVPTWRDRAVLTVGIWKDPRGRVVAPPDWVTTGLHVIAFALAGTLLSFRARQ